MFTGIVEATGTLIQREPTALVIRVPSLLTDVAIKDSIAVDGTCLTVTERGEDWLRVDTMPETLRCTRLGTLQSGDRVNLERSLPADGRIGGHFVQGHVEAAVAVLSVEEDGIALHCTAENPAHLRSFIIPKGFVALNGVSLTVTTCGPESFSFALIPYTRQHTNLGEVHPGMLLNLETDIIGRTVAHLLHDSTWLDTLKYEA